MNKHMNLHAMIALLLGFATVGILLTSFDRSSPSTMDANVFLQRGLQEAEPETQRVAELRDKLTSPRELHFDLESNTTLAANQFLHLHHMKTGGTSIDRYLQCAMRRLKENQGLQVPYTSVHECSQRYYEDCKSGINKQCQDRAANAAIMSFCAPLKDLPSFQWEERPHHGAMTVLRHPVDRVWSMFRFQTKDCFQCTPLLEIYKRLDDGDLMGMEPTCYQQLQNHEVANLLTTDWPETSDDEAIVSEAIENMKSFFTMIGLTEELETTIDMASQVFPWMKRQVEWSGMPCSLSHSNASPQNNHCGKNNRHWYLPDHPDEETRAAIEAHNQMDLKLYAAAVQHFELQKQALDMDDADV